jgi:enamine deaminase RidA (YjgF/YER057c/UK114 family)
VRCATLGVDGRSQRQACIAWRLPIQDPKIGYAYYYESEKTMTQRTISSGTPWEASVGYSRAVQVGQQIFVSGTTASDESGATVAVGDAYAQTRYIFRKIEAALSEAGASMGDVVRTRMFVTNIEQWEDIGRAHGEFFGDIRPAATMVQVSKLVNPDHLIEIEVDAVLE